MTINISAIRNFRVIIGLLVFVATIGGVIWLKKHPITAEALSPPGNEPVQTIEKRYWPGGYGVEKGFYTIGQKLPIAPRCILKKLYSLAPASIRSGFYCKNLVVKVTTANPGKPVMPIEKAEVTVEPQLDPNSDLKAQIGNLTEQVTDLYNYLGGKSKTATTDFDGEALLKNVQYGAAFGIMEDDPIGSIRPKQAEITWPIKIKVKYQGLETDDEYTAETETNDLENVSQPIELKIDLKPVDYYPICQQRPITLSGQVTKSDNLPFSNAVIVFSSWEQVTVADDNGFYELENILPGYTYGLAIFASHDSRQSLPIISPENGLVYDLQCDQTTLNITVQP
jgi:hypothetical protein